MHLAEDHDSLRHLMQVFADEMTAANPDMAGIARLRIGFSKLFRQHMEREDALATTLMQPPANPAVRVIVEEHRTKIRELFLRYSSHIKEWMPDRITTDWPGYRKAVLVLQDQLKDRMVWEERTLHPLRPLAA